ncbi:MAG: hypothetical protein HQL24_09095 [Candidatus Omnitrophica bacterium]|nr:hypothetical protein [Candidatus Omnitrophota bacterium]
MTCLALFWPQAVLADTPLEEKSEHFIIEYYSPGDLEWAKQVLRSAEEYYNKIADEIGYARYQNFWTWNDRVKIIVYPDQKTFILETQQPFWSQGSALQHKKLFEEKSIVSFKQAEGFLTDILPHEMGHLILHDFLGFDKKVPLWFDEGMAQMFEGHRGEKTLEIMRYFIREQGYIPLQTLMNLNIEKEDDVSRVLVFYAESRAILDFLIKKYGVAKFQELCSYLRSGRTFEDALKGAYINQVETVEDLEKKWLNDMKN